MKRQFLGTALSLSLCLAAGTAVPSGAVVQQERQNPDGLCRRAATLPALPPETGPRQQQQRLERRGTGVEPPVMMAPEPMPAPPAPRAVADGEASDEMVVVSGSRVRGSTSGESSSASPAAPEAVSPPADGRIRHVPGGQARSGMLTAGDHDDLLNPELYADYVGKFLQAQRIDSVPFVDTRRVLTVAVQDQAGRPVPFARVTLTCADGNSLSLDTLADGTAAFFPQLDRLGRGVRMSVSHAGRAVGEARQIAIGSDAGAQRHTVTLNGAAAPVTRFDLAVVLDTTGSMGDEINFLTSELRAIVGQLRQEHPGVDIRLALVAYRDEGDVFVTRTYPFTGNADEMQQRLAAQRGEGGGDYPEAMDQAMARAMALDWRPNSVRSLLLVADAPPHDQNVAKTWLIAEAARARRVQITPVAASGVADLAQYVMRAMAAATQSRYLFLTDDSGIGNPHAPPAVDCYLVTKLETLIRRVLDGQISGRRVEPNGEEVIRSVGEYQSGRCVLPSGFKVQEIDYRQN